MNDPKARLIKLIEIGETTYCNVCENQGSTKCNSCEYGNNIRRVSRAELIAEYLIASNVTVPPVSVGQAVYIIRRPTERPAWIDECEITYISVHYFKDGKSTVFSGYNFEVAECDIGKTVFLTREEAEQALKERG